MAQVGGGSRSDVLEGPGNRVVLVVEDDEGIRKLILKSLHKAGIGAEGVANGTDALARAEIDPSLVLLLDQRLPDMTGSDILATLSRKGLRPPFIFMTGQGDERLAVEMMKLGASDYLVKNIGFIDHLPGVIQRLFRELDTEERLRSSERNLHESELRQGKMVANIGDVIVIIDKDGINRYKSPNIEKRFGWRVEEVVGRSTWDNIHPDDLKGAQEFFASLMKVADAMGTFECRYRCSDGGFKWIEFTGVNLLHDPDIRGILGNYHDISERRLHEEELRRSLEEKEVLLREVHHRVKNNLNIVSSLLNLQSLDIQDSSQALRAFQYSQDRIMAMALVHEELYKSRDYARVDMSAYLDKLIQQILKAYDSGGRIQLSARAENMVLSVNACIPCGLIINELIINAYKHAFPKGEPGEISIRLRRSDAGNAELCVTDSGVGLPDGFEAEESPTLGLTLVRLLVGQLGGTLVYDRKGGTSCRINFPVETGA